MGVENERDRVGKEEKGKGKSIDVASITKAIGAIERDMQRAMLELATLKKEVAAGNIGGREEPRKRLGKVNRVVGWLTRRPGADARDAGFVIGDTIKYTIRKRKRR